MTDLGKSTVSEVNGLYLFGGEPYRVGMMQDIRDMLDQQIAAADRAFCEANDKLNQDPQSVMCAKDVSFAYGKYAALVQFRNKLDEMVRRPISR